ncbi:hypothetical protein [Streptomyces globosus]|uniref:hypothetical protein n=1 Tax=Streptomyces globosus TaxID=68209 RepID=UPI001FEADE8D|nr:hypothetical protein [Streptomyces globosus]
MLGLAGALAAKGGGAPFTAAGVLFSGGWPWACFGVLVGYARQSKAESAVLAPAGLGLGVVVYYLCKAFSPVAPIGVVVSGVPQAQVNWAGMLVWGTAAVLFGAPLGVLGNLARHPGVAGLPFRLLVPLTAFYETSLRLGTEGAAGSVATAVWSTVRALAVLAAVALAGHTAWRWRRPAGPR